MSKTRNIFFYDRELTPEEQKAREEKLARFAKAMGHPTRMAILNFLAKQKCCYFGDIHEELPIGLIQGEIEAPKVKYCINRGNWEIARQMFASFFAGCVKKEDDSPCC